MSSTKFFFKDDLDNNNCVGHSMMKRIDAFAFHLKKALGRGNNDEINNFYMEIIDKSTLDKALEGTERL